MRTAMLAAALALAAPANAVFDEGGAETAAKPARCWSSSMEMPERGPTLVGPVDADSRPDSVTTEVEWSGSSACRAEIVVTTRTDELRTAVAAVDGTLLAPPGLAGLVELDRRRGLEIAAVVEHGASTGFLRVYGLRGPSLVPLSAGVFGYGGSVMSRSGVDCARKRGSVLVSSSATFVVETWRYRVVRVFHGMRGGVLRPLPRLTERHSVREARLARFPELALDVPFPSCTVVD